MRSFRFNRLLHLTRWRAFNEIVQLLASALVFTVILIPVVVDTLMWIFVIVIGAGNMIIGGLSKLILIIELSVLLRGWAT